ncbi:hypothetical protein FM121_10415 [Vagococcus fluvialis bH819]|uniref:Uncharacterized protein n=1 Tax=Vagococcus fluvialis bH819 TaxID=1255619 RepID=A0A1X6WS81_9ENTE|nr:hypothetical protein FM121_10415 [Vagococcus fluvialis bH819]
MAFHMLSKNGYSKLSYYNYTPKKEPFLSTVETVLFVFIS